MGYIYIYKCIWIIWIVQRGDDDDDDGDLWIVMIYDDTWRYVIWWYMMIHYDKLWYVDILWNMIIYYDIWWYIMIYVDIWWYIMIYVDLWWYNDDLIHHYLFVLWNIELLQLGYYSIPVFYQIGIHFRKPIGLGITSLGTCSSDFHRDFQVDDCFVELFTFVTEAWTLNK